MVMTESVSCRAPSWGLVLAGLLVVALAGFSAPAPGPLTAEQYLQKLTADADYLDAIVERPDGTSERAAVLQFIQTPAGARNLVELHIRDLLDNVTLGRSLKVAFAVGKRSEDEWEIWFDRIGPTGKWQGGGVGKTTDERLLVTHCLLREIDFEAVGAMGRPGYPGWTFRLLPGARAHEATGIKRILASPRDERVVCVALRADGKPPPEPPVANPPPGTKPWDGSVDPRTDTGFRTCVEAMRSRDPVAGYAAFRALAAAGLSERVEAQDVGMLFRDMALQDPGVPGPLQALSRHLARMGSRARGAIPYIVEVLSSEDKEAIRQAIEAVRTIGPPAAASIPRLREILTMRNGWLRSMAADALGRLGAAAEAAIPDLVACLEFGGALFGSYGFVAAESLGRLGNAAIPALLAVLESGSDMARQGACEALGQIGQGAPASVPKLKALLSHSNLHVRLHAAGALFKIAGDSEAALPVLLQALDSEKPAGSEALGIAIHLLQPMAESARPAVPHLVRLIETRPELIADVRWQAFRVLRSTRSPEALSAILDLIKRGDEPNAWEACHALADFEQLPENVLPVLMEAMRHDSARVRSSAARALGALGADASPAVPLLVAHLQTPAPDDDRSKSAPRFDTLSLTTTIRAIGLIGSRARVALPAVEEYLAANHEPHLRVCAAEAMVRLGEDPRRVIPCLLEVLDRGLQSKDRWPEEHVAVGYGGTAIRLLGECGSAADAAVPRILEYMRGGTIRDRLEAALVLLRARESRDEAHKVIIGHLESPYVEDRKAAVGHIGGLVLRDESFLAEFLPRIEKALGDMDPDVRSVARHVLDKVRSKRR